MSYTPPRTRRPAQPGTPEFDAAPPAGAEENVPAGILKAAPGVLTEQLPEPTLLANEAMDDRDSIQAGDSVLLIVENDLAFARFLLDAVREQGCKGLVSSQGAGALALARDYMPDAITLDIVLPDMDGWRVMDRLKHDLLTRHIPICVVSTEDARERAFDAGALSFLAKPIPSKTVLDDGLAELIATIRRPTRRVLVVGADGPDRDGIAQSIAGEDLIVIAEGPAGVVDAIASQNLDCLIVDARAAVDLADVARAVETHTRFGRLPVLLWGDGRPDEQRIAKSYDGLTVRHVHSRERLVDLVAFFLHRRVTRLPEAQHRLLEELHQSDAVLAGKKVLVVDDDVRNIFALASVLEEHGMTVVSAGNGRDALRIMATQSPIDIVLMDIMMPEMDGIATMREARKIPACQDVPIVAVTAKAMKGDRERCIEAGAWDYLSKPVDSHHMLAVLRSWLYR
jgi:CheY-like chemotaxis protein